MISDTARVDNRDQSEPKAVIAIPTLNEVAHIKSVIEQLSQHKRKLIPIWVFDGGSTDGTTKVIEAMGFEHVSCFENPKKTQAHAINLAAIKANKLGKFNILIRADAHAVYADDFIDIVLECMSNTNADSVVVSMKTLGGNRLQDAASILFSSWLGNGGSAHRGGRTRGYVEHGHHAAFKLDSFLDIKGYDTRFLANEDAELDMRLTHNGHRIFLENKSPVGYIPRKNFSGFWNQMRRNGLFRIWTSIKHNKRLSLRQILPILVGPIFIGSLIAGGMLHPLLLAGAIGYLISVLVLAHRESRKIKGGIINTIPVAVLAVTCHMAFSLGALESLVRFYIFERNSRHTLRNGRQS